MELDRRQDLTWADKLAYLGHRFLDKTQIKCPLEHVFEEGLYIRNIKIPAQTLFISRPHLIGHMVELLKGKILLVEEHKKRILEAPYHMRTVPGYQIVFYAMTDVEGRAIHMNPLEERDINVLESRFYGPVDELKALGKQISDRIDVLQSPAELLKIEGLV